MPLAFMTWSMGMVTNPLSQAAWLRRAIPQKTSMKTGVLCGCDWSAVVEGEVGSSAELGPLVLASWALVSSGGLGEPAPQGEAALPVGAWPVPWGEAVPGLAAVW